MLRCSHRDNGATGGEISLIYILFARRFNLPGDIRSFQLWSGRLCRQTLLPCESTDCNLCTSLAASVSSGRKNILGNVGCAYHAVGHQESLAWFEDTAWARRHIPALRASIQ